MIEAGPTALGGGGRTVVNPSGGLLRKGHPIGATGIAQVVELAEQLQRTLRSSPGRQRPDCARGKRRRLHPWRCRRALHHHPQAVRRCPRPTCSSSPIWLPTGPHEPGVDVLTFEHQAQTEIRTYRQLWENGQRIAAELKRLGLKKGDRFALLLLNHPEFVETMVASAILGTVFVPIDPRTRGAKLAYMLRDSGCRGVICADYSLDGLIEAAPQAPAIEWVLLLGAADRRRCPVPGAPARRRACCAAALAVDARRGRQRSRADADHVHFGDDQRSERHRRAACPLRRGVEPWRGGVRLPSGDRPYTGLSLTHGNAQFVTLAPSLKMGLRAVFSRKFTKSRLWEIVSAHGCTTFSLLGGMATAIYAEPDARRCRQSGAAGDLGRDAGGDLGRFRTALRRRDLRILWRDGRGHEFQAGRRGARRKLRPRRPGTGCKVVDEEGNEVPPGSSGELWFQLAAGRSPVTYINNPEASAKKVVDGWLRSGDSVRWMRTAGSFTTVGRAAASGATASSSTRPSSRRCSPSSRGRRRVRLRPPARKTARQARRTSSRPSLYRGATFEPHALFAWARDRLEQNLVPSFLQIVAEIPKTASEKPQERFLAQLSPTIAIPCNALRRMRP